MRWPQIVRLVFVGTILLAATVFTIQNLSRSTVLSFDVYVYAWRLSQPVAVPWIIWGSFGAGFVLATISGWAARRRLTSTVSRLEQEALLRSAGRPASPPAAMPDTPAAPTGDDWGR